LIPRSFSGKTRSALDASKAFQTSVLRGPPTPARKTEKACTCKTETKQSRPLNRMQEQSCRMGRMNVHGNRRRRSLALLCWSLFAAGLLVQLLSPHLKISNGAFVIPPKMAAGRNTIRPDEIVGRQRRLQFVSLLLTVGGALGLAFLYRDILIGAASRRRSGPVEEPASRDSTRSQNPGPTRNTLDKENHT
jgi:hypothetical protein